ncbi:hypothetical protein NDU88_004866 [Pleurodeles waltl]|uniref:Uncharacterized protein n=1 Tax=Pleurodeles waltl TaxID=8319 RepID=A0AAV7UHA8_PLEWA|nr:hypothetical protein NDU88_004866 [Pleurodeles waltl]
MEVSMRLMKITVNYAVMDRNALQAKIEQLNYEIKAQVESQMQQDLVSKFLEDMTACLKKHEDVIKTCKAHKFQCVKIDYERGQEAYIEQVLFTKRERPIKRKVAQVEKEANLQVSDIKLMIELKELENQTLGLTEEVNDEYIINSMNLKVCDGVVTVFKPPSTFMLVTRRM